MFIYKVVNEINNKMYIGYDTGSVSKMGRWYRHKLHASKDSNPTNEPNKYLYNSMRKHGVENFSIEVIDKATSVKQLKEKEIYWISKHNTFLGDGYNLTPGGDGGKGNQSFLDKLTESEKKQYSNKLSNACTAAWNNSERKQKQSLRSKKYWDNLTEEDKIQRFKKSGKKKSEQWNRLSEEDKQVLRDKNALAQKKRRAKMTTAEKEKESKSNSNRMKEYWANISPEEKQKRLQKTHSKTRKIK